MPLKLNYQGWEVVSLRHDLLQLIFLPQLGGRLINVLYDGHPWFYQDEQMKGRIFQRKDQPRSIEGIITIGGDKVWIAPQASWLNGVPSFDLNLGPYQIIDVGKKHVSMLSVICEETGLQVRRYFELDHVGLKLTDEVMNQSNRIIECGIWNVSQIQRPCHVQLQANSGSIRSYHHQDKSLPVVKDPQILDGFLSINCDHDQLFKYGGFPLIGECLVTKAIGNRHMWWKRQWPIDQDKDYAHQSAWEIFNSQTKPYVEVEVHGPKVKLAPGDKADLSQQWSFGYTEN